MQLHVRYIGDFIHPESQTITRNAFGLCCGDRICLVDQSKAMLVKECKKLNKRLREMK